MARDTESNQELFSEISDGQLEALAESRGQKLLEIEGAPEGVAFFDWFALETAEEEDESNTANEIREYHFSDEATAKVEKGDWVPFGIVGIGSHPESFEETGADGTLFMDLSRAEDGDAAVVFVPNSGVESRLTKNGKSRVLKLGYQELMETLTEG